jgi:hypothetical protein
LTHRFSGGWAPSFGKLVSKLPQQTTEIEIPYVLEAENIFWTLEGGIRKVPGTTKTSAELAGGAEVMGLYDFWRIGATGSATRRKVAHVSTVIMEDQGSDTWQDLTTGLEDGKQPNYATFADLLIISSDGNTDVPMSWDQTIFQNLAGSPPNFAFSLEHKNRHWAAGAIANPSRLYYSAADDPEDWTGAGSGFIDVSPGDGDEIRGLTSFKNEVWVFKGPNKGSIHRITGSTPSDFAKTLFIRGLACVGHSSITSFRDDVLFMTPSGSIRSLKATDAFGDYHDAAITFPINQYLLDNLNKSQLKNVWAVTDPGASRLFVAVPTGSSATNDLLLVFDYQFASINKPDRWSRITAWNAQSLGIFTIAGLPTLYIGGADGFIRSTTTATRAIDTTGTINARVKTPFLNYGSSTQFKTLANVGLTLSPQGGSQTVEFMWNRDSKYSNFGVVDQGLTPGIALGVFQLDVDALGESGGTFHEVYIDTEEGGDFRWVQWTIKQEELDEDLFLHAFSTGLQFDAFGTERV